MTTVTESVRPPRELNDVRGWFPNLDQVLFDWLLTRQESRGQRGDLLEVGAYMGKSAIFVGEHRQQGEKFTVCDLFDSPAPDDANSAEMAKSYSSLTRRAFEQNYLSFHEELPRVIQAPSSVVPEEVAPGSCRFVHIDASHLYEHVYGDIAAARDALLPGGVVVLDDFRSEHTPGVAIATWEAVLNRGLNPICLSTQKLYGTWDDPEPIQEELLDMLRGRPDCGVSVQEAAGHRLIRASSKGLAAPPFPPARHLAGPTSTPAPEPGPAPEAAPAARPAPRPARRSRTRRVAREVLPPILLRALRRLLARGKSRGRQ